MSEKVIKKFLLKEVTRPVLIEPPKMDVPTEDEEQEAGEKEKQPLGPTPEELQKIIDDKTKEAEAKAREIIEKANIEAKQIKTVSENWAFDQVRKANDEYEAKIKEAQLKSQEIEKEARIEADKILDKIKKEADKIKNEAYEEGFAKGREDGYGSGAEETKRLISVLHKVSGEFIKKREIILEETEKEMIDLVLLIATKVIKTISETQKRVVYDNILSALDRIKGRAEVTIKINPEDIYTVTKYKQDFIENVEGIENIRILEDPNVDKGGCIVTSEFGSIDARIKTQLAEIEDQIKKLSPIRQEDGL